MQPTMMYPQMKPTTKARCDDERAELYKIRDAAWDSQRASGKTGTCEFLKLLLDIYRQIDLLDRMGRQEAQSGGVQKAPVVGSAPFDADRLKGLESSVAHLGSQVQGIDTAIHKLEATLNAHTTPSTPHTVATSEMSGKDKAKR